MTAYTVKPTANRKYVRQLLSQLPDGIRIGMIEETGDHQTPARPLNRTHPCVLTPDGTLLRHNDGRLVTICNTPGSVHSLKGDLQAIKRALAQTA